MDEREKRLPTWARDLIANLDKQVKSAAPELAKLQKQLEKVTALNSALTELLDCAARGGHKTSQEIVEIIEAYDLELRLKE